MSGNYEPDQMDYTPEMALQEALDRVKASPEEFTGCVVLLLNNETSRYHTAWHMGGVKLSDAVGLLAWQQADFLHRMRESREDTGGQP